MSTYTQLKTAVSAFFICLCAIFYIVLIMHKDKENDAPRIYTEELQTQEEGWEAGFQKLIEEEGGVFYTDPFGVEHELFCTGK